jgi:homoserine/homoserine lactone efflux protein
LVFVHPRTWLLFAATETVLCLTPGPAVLFVLSSALRSGARKSLYSNLGILAANTIYFVLSAAGIGSLLVASFDLFSVVKWIGAAYLIFLGLRSIFGSAGVLATGVEEKQTRPLRMLGDGFVLQASNPKALIFFTALLPQFLDPRAPIASQVGVLALTSIVIEFVVLLGYGALAGRASTLAREPRYAVWTNRAAGAVLICAGAGLATIRKSA